MFFLVVFSVLMFGVVSWSIVLEGFMSVLVGFWGMGIGVMIFMENVYIIVVIKMGSCCVVEFGVVVLIFMFFIGEFFILNEEIFFV